MSRGWHYPEVAYSSASELSLFRRFHSVCQKDQKLFVFGGETRVRRDGSRTPTKKTLSDLLEYDTGTEQWRVLHCANLKSRGESRVQDKESVSTGKRFCKSNLPCPLGRKGASLVPFEEKLYLFGGAGAGSSLNDFWEFDLISNTWKDLGLAYVKECLESFNAMPTVSSNTQAETPAEMTTTTLKMNNELPHSSSAFSDCRDRSTPTRSERSLSQQCSVTDGFEEKAAERSGGEARLSSLESAQEDLFKLIEMDASTVKITALFAQKFPDLYPAPRSYHSGALYGSSSSKQADVVDGGSKLCEQTVLETDGPCLILYGGFGTNADNALWTYEIRNQRFQKENMTPTDVNPGARFGCFTCIYSDGMFLFGGQQGKRLADTKLWRLDLRALTWQIIPKSEASGAGAEKPLPETGGARLCPTARTYGSSCVVYHGAKGHRPSGASWFCHGGSSIDKVFYDGYELDLSTFEWNPSLSTVHSLEGHTLSSFPTEFGSIMILFGGASAGPSMPTGPVARAAFHVDPENAIHRLMTCVVQPPSAAKLLLERYRDCRDLALKDGRTARVKCEMDDHGIERKELELKSVELNEKDKEAAGSALNFREDGIEWGQKELVAEWRTFKAERKEFASKSKRWEDEMNRREAELSQREADLTSREAALSEDRKTLLVKSQSIEKQHSTLIQKEEFLREQNEKFVEDYRKFEHKQKMWQQKDTELSALDKRLGTAAEDLKRRLSAVTERERKMASLAEEIAKREDDVTDQDVKMRELKARLAQRERDIGNLKIEFEREKRLLERKEATLKERESALDQKSNRLKQSKASDQEQSPMSARSFRDTAIDDQTKALTELQRRGENKPVSNVGVYRGLQVGSGNLRLKKSTKK